MTPKEPATLETSFWTVGHRADVLQYLFSYFDVQVPPSVRDEVLVQNPRYPRRRYGYAELFRVMHDRGLLPIVAPSQAMDRFGRGESEAIGLAQERGWRLLINDQRPQRYARGLGLATTTVPTFILRLYVHEVLSYRAAQHKLTLIEAVTTPGILRPVREALDLMARRRKDISP